jgi:hypothetical protein
MEFDLFVFLLPLPLAGEGWGEGAGDLPDLFHHRICLHEHIVVPEAKRPKSKCSHFSGSLLVMRQSCRLVVLPTVKFYDQADLNAREIGKVPTHGVLTTEFQAKQLPVAKT